MLNPLHEIIGVAILTPQGEIISMMKPNRHCDILFSLIKEGNSGFYESEQGFIDQQGNFLNRRDALKIALDNEQVKYDNLVAPPELFSEDLW